MSGYEDKRDRAHFLSYLERIALALEKQNEMYAAAEEGNRQAIMELTAMPIDDVDDGDDQDHSHA